ncbi:MAG TPA: RluA family pseudouridine synthase [Methylomusa anaerophila]|uniref:Pseudouridine synthase n=1 Tax=Methylomusa anaerophila TaxID=1930071 RepID=A0A348ANH8_9FIRM|nr:RluA family pseudouridine synthase [Methylomusa anaerophila]BBB92626.1 ribosomal large subunit pseudouridine synthase D [Methylomusa anaerophila]HML87520.1 RluA family pseudouridine synthase [Methylomusa anaerophila]
MRSFVIPEGFDGMSVKDFLRRDGISLSLWRKIKQSGSVEVNGLPAAPRTPLKAGDVIRVIWPVANDLAPIPLDLVIRYEDDYLLVVDKPPGLLVHPVSLSQETTLANGIINYFQTKGLSCGFHPVNRLDRNTSGLVLIAKAPDVHHLLNQRFPLISKEYLAIVSGVPYPLSGIIEAAISRCPDSIIKRMVNPGGQSSITAFQVVHVLTNNIASLVKLSLKTGRTHQIRVHMSHIGHPLLGDDLYGGSTELISRQALHASRLVFPHPVSRQSLSIESPLPDDICALLTRLSNNW